MPGNNATGRSTGVGLALYLLLLACMGGAYMGRRALEPAQAAAARGDRFWARGIPVADLAALPATARAQALASLTRELSSLSRAAGPVDGLVKAAERCLGGDAAGGGAEPDAEGCRRLDTLARARRVQSNARLELHLRTSLGMWGCVGLVALVCAVLLFRLLGRAGRTALGLSLIGFLAHAGVEASTRLEQDKTRADLASLDRLVMKIRLGLENPGAAGRKRLGDLAHLLPRLPAAERPESKRLARALVRCREDGLACPRVLTPLTRYQRAVLRQLEPSPSRRRLSGWLQISAALVLLLVPMVGGLDRRK